jgi:hypothetical protein
MSNQPHTITFQVREAVTVTLEAPKRPARNPQAKPKTVPEASQDGSGGVTKEEN